MEMEMEAVAEVEVEVEADADADSPTSSDSLSLPSSGSGKMGSLLRPELKDVVTLAEVLKEPVVSLLSSPLLAEWGVEQWDRASSDLGSSDDDGAPSTPPAAFTSGPSTTASVTRTLPPESTGRGPFKEHALYSHIFEGTGKGSVMRTQEIGEACGKKTTYSIYR